MELIGHSAKKGLDFIKSRAKETMDVQKLSSQLKQLEERREQCLLDIGHRVLVAYGTEDLKDETFRDRVEEIAHLKEEMERVKAEYEGTLTHLKSSMEDLLPKKPKPPIPGPDYETL